VALLFFKGCAWGAFWWAFEWASNRVPAPLLLLGEKAPVNVNRHLDGRMAHLLLEVNRGNSITQKKARISMPDVMESDFP
jgi:hypothetical protein